MAEPRPPTTMDFDFLAAVVYGLTRGTNPKLIIEELRVCPITNWQTRNPFPELSPVLYWFEATLAELLGLESITDVPLPTELAHQLEGMTELQAIHDLQDYFIQLMEVRLIIANILLNGRKQ